MVRSLMYVRGHMSGCVHRVGTEHSKPLPDVLNTDELQVQQMRLGVFVLVAAIWTWESFQR